MEIVSLLGAILDRMAFEQDVDWDNVNDIIVKLDSIINSISDVKIQNELKNVRNQIRELVK